MLRYEILGMHKVIGRIYAHMIADAEVKFILTLVICNATSDQFEWPQKFDSFYDCARMGYKANELRITEFGQTYVDKK